MEENVALEAVCAMTGEISMELVIPAIVVSVELSIDVDEAGRTSLFELVHGPC